MYRCVEETELIEDGDILIYADGDTLRLGPGWWGSPVSEIAGWGGTNPTGAYNTPAFLTGFSVAVLRLEETK